MNNTITHTKNKQGILSVCSRLTGMLAIFFLAACSTIAPEVTPSIPPDLTQVDISLNANAITGTTTAMEYSLSSTDGFDGTWLTASDGYTPVTFVEGNIYIREAANHQNVRLVKVIGPGMVIIVNLDDVDINVAEGNITETAVEMEYSLNSTNGFDGTWAAASNANTAVTFEAGRVYVREAANPNNMRLVAIIAPAIAAPALVYDDEANTITGLTESYEYMIDAGTWTDGTVVPDLSGNKMIKIRTKATASALPSLNQIINFTTDAVVLFDHNYDGTETLLQLGYQVSNSVPANIALISPLQHASGTKSFYFPASGTTVSRYFASSDLTPSNPDGFENLIVECKVYTASATSLSFGLYPFSSTSPVIRLTISGSTLKYHNSTGVVTAFDPVVDIPLNQWIQFRIVIADNKYSIYMNGSAIATDVATPISEHSSNPPLKTATRFYCTSSAVAAIDDLKISYIPTTP